MLMLFCFKSNKLIWENYCKQFLNCSGIKGSQESLNYKSKVFPLFLVSEKFFVVLYIKCFVMAFRVKFREYGIGAKNVKSRFQKVKNYIFFLFRLKIPFPFCKFALQRLVIFIFQQKQNPI